MMWSSSDEREKTDTGYNDCSCALTRETKRDTGYSDCIRGPTKQKKRHGFCSQFSRMSVVETNERGKKKTHTKTKDEKKRKKAEALRVTMTVAKH